MQRIQPKSERMRRERKDMATESPRHREKQQNFRFSQQFFNFFRRLGDSVANLSASRMARFSLLGPALLMVLQMAAPLLFAQAAAPHGVQDRVTPKAQPF